MKLIDDRASHPPAPRAPDDEFERLRDTFGARLRSDQIRLTTLAASLARIEGSPAGVFLALQTLAHRIRGAAAIFEATELSSAAYVLEQAAANACSNCSDHTDGAVWSALEELVERMAMSCGSDTANVCDLTPILHLCKIADEAESGPRKRSRYTKRR
jgi:HPt (histidine-containing phosphotransfer) domain-containing protein